MNALNQALIAAFAANGQTKEANKAYLEFIKANFIIPLEGLSTEDKPQVLFLEDEGICYLPVFTERAYLDAWARDIASEIKILTLTGVNLLKGLGEEVRLCLDIGTAHYKMFLPEETARLRSMVLKLFK